MMKKYLFFLAFFISPLAHSIECPEGTYFVSEYYREAYHRNDGTYVSASNVNDYCRNYRGDGPLVPVFKSKMPSRWPHGKEIFRKCSDQEEKKIASILKAAPKTLNQIGQMQVFCAVKSDSEDNPASSAPSDKMIVLYDLAFKSDTTKIVIHELAHIFYDLLSIKERDSYWMASDWKSKKGQPPYTERTTFSADDGMMSPDEDFANNVEYYFSETQSFKIHFPKIFLWMESHIGGIK